MKLLYYRDLIDVGFSEAQVKVIASEYTVLDGPNDDGSVIFEDLTNSTGVLVVAGPKARQLMQKVSTDDFSNENFKWLTDPINLIRHVTQTKREQKLH